MERKIWFEKRRAEIVQQINQISQPLKEMMQSAYLLQKDQAQATRSRKSKFPCDLNNDSVPYDWKMQFNVRKQRETSPFWQERQKQNDNTYTLNDQRMSNGGKFIHGFVPIPAQIVQNKNAYKENMSD